MTGVVANCNNSRKEYKNARESHTIFIFIKFRNKSSITQVRLKEEVRILQEKSSSQVKYRHLTKKREVITTFNQIVSEKMEIICTQEDGEQQHQVTACLTTFNPENFSLVLQITQKENISNVLTDEQKEQLKEKMMDCKRPNLDKKHRKLDKKR